MAETMKARQGIQGRANQVAGRDIINIKNVHITLDMGVPSMTAENFDPDFPYRLSEDQQTKLYHARHLLTVLDSLAMVGTASDKFVDIPREILAIVFGMARDLVKEGMPAEGEAR